LIKFNCSRSHQCLLGHCIVIDQRLLQAQIVIISVVSKNLPADLHLELPYQDLIESLKSFKSYALECLRFIEVLALPDKHVLQCCNVIPLKLFFKNFSLKVYYVLIAQEPIVISVQNPENAKESFFEVWLELLAHRVL